MSAFETAPLGEEPSRQARVWPRFVVFAIAVAIVVTVLGGRMFQLQVHDAGRYEAIAVRQRQATVPIPVQRGLMYDRKGRLLVENVPSFVVKIKPADLPYSQRDRVVERLAELLQTDKNDLIARLDRAAGDRFSLLTVADQVPTPVARVIAEEHLTLPGVIVDVRSRRHYLYGSLLAHVLGWTGRISTGDYDRLKSLGYQPDDVIGKAGLEQTFEDELRGTYGLKEVQKDGAGRTIRELRTIQDPDPGHSLELTIDVKIQREAEKALKWAMNIIGLKRGVFMVMNPQTGEILAMVSLPAYDDNAMANGITAAQYKKLVNRPDRPLINLAIQEHNPPGSTYKLITGVGALQDGKITAQTRILTRAFITYAGWKYWDWNKEGWGWIPINLGFAHSSDTFFYQVAAKLGIDRLAYWAHEFGFGERTGVDLPGEVRGIIPTNDWAQKYFHRDVYPGEVFQAGIGQGFNMVTPMQLINAYAALANGGTLYRPQLVRRVLAADGHVIKGFTPEIIRKLPIDPRHLATMRAAARSVLVVRHTYNLVDEPIVIAGKSGTAEFGLRDNQGRLPFHSWFVGFTPKDARKTSSDPQGYEAVRRTDSQLVFLAFAYDSRTRGNAATEIVKYFLQMHYNIHKDLREAWILQRDNFYGG
ncbi:MAG: penicillin-binding protein 2 [Chloroflexota bacterium]